MSEFANKKEAQVEVRQEIESLVPEVDIYENSDAFVLVADMPGLDPNAILVRLDRETLLVEGESEIDGLRVAKYAREFRVMRGLEPESVKADYQAGVLTVHLPKPSSMKPRRIQVTAG